MSDRQALLLTSLKRRLLDTQRHVETLRLACAKFGADFEVDLFLRAWNGADQDEKLAAYSVQAGYENAINGAIKVAQELTEIAGWTPPNLEPSSVEALRALKDNGVIAKARIHTQLKDAYERRSDLQHDYANTLARDIHEAAVGTLESVPPFLEDVHLFVTRTYG